ADQGTGGTLLVVVEAARALVGAARVAVRVPNLHLRAAAKIDSAISGLLDLPIDEELEVGIVAGRREAESLAIVDELAVLDLPVLAHALVGLLLGRGELCGCGGRPLLRTIE